MSAWSNRGRTRQCPGVWEVYLGLDMIWIWYTSDKWSKMLDER